MVINDGSDRGRQVLYVMQGQLGATSDPKLVYTAFVGSCVAVCLWDPVVKLGGMTIFLFPEGGADTRFGPVAIAALMQQIVDRGGQTSRLEAMLYGGAKVHEGRRDIGKRNADFATRMLTKAGVPIVAQDLGGHAVRRIRFFATTGKSVVEPQSQGPSTLPS